MIQTARELTVYYCGREKCAPGHYFGPAVRPHYLLHVILQGKGVYRAGGKTYVLKKGDAFLIRPSEVTYYQADEAEPWEYAWTAFGGELAEALLKKYGQGEDPYIYHFMEKGRWTDWILGLVKAFLKGGHNQDEMTGYLFLLFSQLPRREEAGPDYEQGYLARAESYIRHNYSYPVQIQDVARHVGIDRTYLYKLFMKHKGVSPKDFLTAFRIMEAERLLEETSLSVTEIALSCGFHDASVFCRNFQKAEGVAPLKYRKNFQHLNKKSITKKTMY